MGKIPRSISPGNAFVSPNTESLFHIASDFFWIVATPKMKQQTSTHYPCLLLPSIRATCFPASLPTVPPRLPVPKPYIILLNKNCFHVRLFTIVSIDFIDLDSHHL
jgi:hypothetical protein